MASLAEGGIKQSLLIALFLISAFFFYFQSLLNARQFLASFLTLITIAILTMSLRSGAEAISITNYQLPITVFFGFLFFLLLGIKNLIFIKREPLYYFLNGLLLLTVFICFFSFNNFKQPFQFLAVSLAAFSAIFFIFKEFLFVSLRGEAETILAPIGSRIKNLMASGAAFLSLQFLWVIGFLPFSVINAASLALLIALILEDLIIHHLSGNLNKRIILRNITMFLILAMIIFGASEWTP